MKFTLSSTALSSRLSALAKVINSKNSLAILDCFLFQVKEGKLTITASDSENVMKSTIDLNESDSEGQFCVSNHTILDAVKELSEQPLTFDIDVDSLNINISYQNGHFNFIGQNADEYPTAQEVTDNSTVISIGSDILSDNINRSLFATAQDELRPVMNGVYFDISPEYLAIVATDGHKLVRNKDFSIKSETPASFILPKKPANLLKNLLSRDSGDVEIKFNDRNAEIKFTDGLISCRLIEGRYPNYNSVIPQDNPNKLSIDRAALFSALKRVLVSASQSSSLIRFHIQSGLLTLKADDSDYGRSAEENIVCEYSGNGMDIGFKGTSMIEILSNLTSQEVNIMLADPSRPGVIIPSEQPENEDILMLIMPMLLND